MSPESTKLSERAIDAESTKVTEHNRESRMKARWPHEEHLSDEERARLKFLDRSLTRLRRLHGEIVTERTNIINRGYHREKAAKEKHKGVPAS